MHPSIPSAIRSPIPSPVRPPIPSPARPPIPSAVRQPIPSAVHVPVHPDIQEYIHFEKITYGFLKLLIYIYYCSTVVGEKNVRNPDIHMHNLNPH